MTTRPRDWAHQRQSMQDKTVVLAGGTTGIGRATARLLVEQGAKVLIFGRNEQPLRDALKDIGRDDRCFGLTADQSREEDIDRVFKEADEKLGGLDVLINNAAVAAKDLESTDQATIRYVIETNLLGYLICTKHALDRMVPRGSGHIINVGSMSADTLSAGEGVYAATKAAIQGWSVSLRKAVNKKGIKVTLIEPGSVGTDLASGDPQQQRNKQRDGNMLTAEDIAESMLYTLIQPARCDVVGVQIRPHGQTI